MEFKIGTTSSSEVFGRLTAKLRSRRFWRYVAVGSSTFALDFCLLVFFRELLNVPVLAAATIAYWSAIVFNFLLNRQWTFKVGGEDIGRHAFGYTMLLVFNYFANLILITVLVKAGFHYTLAKVIAVGLQVPWTYLAYRYIIFKPAAKQEANR